MLTNPLWRQSLAGFRDSLRQWFFGNDPEGPMRLAIFFDARAVAGDAALLAAAREHLNLIFAGQDTYLARFAAAADQFHEPKRWWARLTGQRDEQAIDLKKLGTFPIVHGARALALQYGVNAAGTVQRLQQLAEQHRIDPALAREAVQALHALMALRLTHQLRLRDLGQSPGNEVRPSALDVPERQALRDALAVVQRWRLFLRLHFRLNNL